MHTIVTCQAHNFMGKLATFTYYHNIQNLGA
jgi:hypothetical protein